MPAIDKVKATTKWWRKDLTDEERAGAISQTLNRIVTSQASRRALYKLYLRMYSSQALPGMGMKNQFVPNQSSGALALNVTKSCIDTFAATLTKEKPKVTFQTSGADWDLQRRAQDLTKFIAGQFLESKVYDKNPMLALDAGIFGTGIYKPYIDGEGDEQQICIDRVLPTELHVDDQEAVYGNPRNYFQTKWIDREVLKDYFPKKKKEIDSATRVYDRTIAALELDSTADQLLVVEAWHMEPNGRHSICLYNSELLLDEPYTRELSPFVFYRRSPAPTGLWGIGLAEELKGIQYEINILLRKIQRAHKLLSAGHWVVEASSMVQPSQIDDQIGSIIRYRGTAPELRVGQAISPEIYKHLWDLYQRAYEITGISQFQSQGVKPAGLDSGEALRVYRDTVNVRAQIAQDNFHAAHLELAEQIIDLAREISKTFPDFSARAVSGESMTRVKFLNTDLKKEEYVLQMFPTNALADDPAMRMAQVQEFAQAGWIKDQDAKRLLDFPDLKAWSDEENASHDIVEDIIESIMTGGKFKGPEPFMDLQSAMAQVQKAYLLNRRKNAPEKKLKLLRQWITQAQEMLQAATPPPPPAPPPGAPPPMMSNGGSPLSPVGPPPMPPGGPGGPPPPQ